MAVAAFVGAVICGCWCIVGVTVGAVIVVAVGVVVGAVVLWSLV